jgi:hypothetical protein|tara:strand:+ start:965 stop:1135 length:171 start_codon:yes stop_codon:yes gene_type:complete
MKDRLIALGNGALNFLKRNAHHAILMYAGCEVMCANFLKMALAVCLWAFVDLYRNK